MIDIALGSNSVLYKLVMRIILFFIRSVAQSQVEIVTEGVFLRNPDR